MKKLKITLNGKSYEVDVEILKDDDAATMPFQPYPTAPMGAYPAASAPVAAAAAPRPAVAPVSSDGNNLSAPMNGVVIEVPIKAGDTVKTGQIIIVLEAMKMKTNISSAIDGKIATVNVSPNDSVETGQVLVTYA